MEFADRLQKRQLEILGGRDDSRCEDLRRAAEANPADAEAVAAWLGSDIESGQAIDFFQRHREIVPRTSEIGSFMAIHLFTLKR